MSEKLQSQQKHAIRIIFHEKKCAHTQEHFKENNVLNIYQLNIFSNLPFLHQVKNGKALNVFFPKFLSLRIINQPVSLEKIILYLSLS